ncbi:helix-turn-helix domain-containing protein [Kordiimonas sp.]|uniref:helix-turn-helix domain-containing protein n=1 Tax=Kordiimonas sp. TaxID=1970157 RepID=UPI003B515C0F
MNEAPSTMGEMLKRARLARGWSRVEFSRLTGISANTIAKYEKAGEPGGQYPSMPRLAAIAALYELDARLLLALCAEDRDTANTIMNTDKVQNRAATMIDGLSGVLSMLFPNQESNELDASDRDEALKELIENLTKSGEPLYGSKEASQILASKPNKKSPEDDLPSPPSSNPNQTSLAKKENEDGPPST